MSMSEDRLLPMQVVRTNRLRCFFVNERLGVSGDVTYEAVKGCKFVVLVLGVEGPGEKLDGNAVLETHGWVFPPDPPSESPPASKANAKSRGKGRAKR